jgi:hypothetical protein
MIYPLDLTDSRRTTRISYITHGSGDRLPILIGLAYSNIAVSAVEDFVSISFSCHYSSSVPACIKRPAVRHAHLSALIDRRQLADGAVAAGRGLAAPGAAERARNERALTARPATWPSATTPTKRERTDE